MRSSRVSVLARFGAAAAVAAIALVPAVAASASSAHHPVPKAPSNLLVNAHFVRGSGHKSDTINGLLRSRHHALAGETVALESRTAHTKFAVVASATTDANGKVSFTVTPTTRTAYRLVFAGDATHRGCHSAVVILRAPKK